MKHFVKDNYFEVVSDVNSTWSKIKGIPDYRKEIGVELFQRMFVIAPTVWSQIFPWAKGVTRPEDLEKNHGFLIFAKQFIGMLDMAIDMLGPDLELVEAQLQQLGIRHISYGVMPKHYPLMGKALLQTIESKLGDKFNDRLHESWNSIYTFMSVSMMQGAFQELVKIREEHNVLKAEEIVRQKRQERLRARKEKRRSQEEVLEKSERSSSTARPSPTAVQKPRPVVVDESERTVSSYTELSSSGESITEVDEEKSQFTSQSARSSKPALRGFVSSTFMKRFGAKEAKQ